MNKDTVTYHRERWIGGSDLSAIMGLSPFKTRWDLLQEKAEIKPIEQISNPYIEYGNALEPLVRDYINEKYCRDFEPAVKVDGDLRGNCDGIDEGGLLEIKTTSHVYDTLDGYKGYLVQILFYMKIFNVQHAMLAVYHRNEDFSTDFDPSRLQVIPIDIKDHLDTMDEVEQAIEMFRKDLAELRENPLLCEEDFMPNEIVEVTNKIMELENQLAAYKQMEAELKEFKAKLKVAMEEYGIKTWRLYDNTKITLVPDGEDKEVEEIDIKALQKDHPELFGERSKYVKRKLKKGRSGFVRITSSR